MAWGMSYIWVDRGADCPSYCVQGALHVSKPVRAGKCHCPEHVSHGQMDSLYHTIAFGIPHCDGDWFVPITAVLRNSHVMWPTYVLIPGGCRVVWYHWSMAGCTVSLARISLWCLSSHKASAQICRTAFPRRFVSIRLVFDCLQVNLYSTGSPRFLQIGRVLPWVNGRGHPPQYFSPLWCIRVWHHTLRVANAAIRRGWCGSKLGK